MNDTTLSIYSVFAPRKHKQKKAIKREWRLLAPGNSDPDVFLKSVKISFIGLISFKKRCS
jgi:hypothetical protein